MGHSRGMDRSGAKWSGVEACHNAFAINGRLAGLEGP